MWWFLRRHRPGEIGTAAEPRPQSEEQLLAHVPDLETLAGHDIAIKIWLPELAARTLKWVADYEGVSQSSWVREHLFSYLYGAAAMAAHRIRAERSGANEIRFSRRAVDRSAGRWIYKVPQLGKNTVAFKVWSSQRMRDDLQLLAGHAGVGLSPFVREAIVGALLGRGSLPERPEIMGQPTDAAKAWELGEQVPVATVEEGDFDGLGEAEKEWQEDR